MARYAERLGLSPERPNRLVYLAAPISQLAFELGFDDPAYFCRFFRRQTGASPSEYRRRVLGQ